MSKEVTQVAGEPIAVGTPGWKKKNAVPFKDARYGESYSAKGLPQSLRASPAPTAEEARAKGW